MKGILHFRASLPSISRFGKKVTAKLDVDFPMLIAGHELVGKNRRAGPDAKMLRLMVLLLNQLQKPTEKRDRSIFPMHDTKVRHA